MNNNNSFGYRVIIGFNCTAIFKSGRWGKSSMSKDLFKLILWNEIVRNEVKEVKHMKKQRTV